MKTTGGFKHWKNHIANADADVVQRLKAEGAIILCKTNTSTAALTFEPNNKLFGRTNNPRDLSRLIMPVIPSAYPLSSNTQKALQMVQQFFSNITRTETEELPAFVAKLPLHHLKILTIDGAMDLNNVFLARETLSLSRTMLKEAISHDTPYYYYFLKTMMLAKAGTKVFRTRSDRLDKLQDRHARFINAGNRMLDNAVMVLPVYPTPAKKYG